MRIRRSAAITARKLMPFARKHQPSGLFTRCASSQAIAPPAIAGPKTRAPLKIEELRAMAFGKSSLPTICTRNAWRIGTSKAFTMPTRKATTIIIQAPRSPWTKPVSVRPASSTARNIAAACVQMTPLRSEEHTSELQSRGHLVCRLLLEQKNKLDPLSTLRLYKKNEKQGCNYASYG